MKKQSWNDIAGTTIPEKMQGLGVTVGKEMDILKLCEIAEESGAKRWFTLKKTLQKRQPTKQT